MKPSLSIERAADLLNVSLPFLIHETELGVLPIHAVNGRMRIQVADFVMYRKRVRASRDLAMQDLATQAQELQMGYGDT